jgi:hypothetical protein
MAAPEHEPRRFEMNAAQETQTRFAMESFAPALEIQLKAERVQEPASLQEQQAEAFLVGLSVQPVQPVSITLSGTSVVFTLHGPGGVSPGEAS